MMTSAAIRQQFLDFFRSKGHTIVPSAPIVVKNDPTLLFTNAGMNQFKDYFLGNRKPESTRVADTQKCLRVSGKHNDLEEVGVDTYHHTMFEMLGNWSFGDYFKKEAIAWSWELLTEIYKIDTNKIYVTVFEGDTKENLPFDEEAYNEWKKYIAEERILKGNKKDNFWEMGDTGPCGPCSEIHVDCRTEEERKTIDGKTLVNNDHPQVIEIWNNVFMQFNRLKDGTLEPLPAQHVDTGMGFERLVRVLQNKQSNYDTDVFTGTIHETEKITGKKYDYSDSREAVAFRVIADHIRAISFTIADGQLPANTGAGYVIRRILRRAVRYYYSSLDYRQPLLYVLVPVIADQFKNVFPELTAQLDFVTRVVKEEEEAFMRTLSKGISHFEEHISDLDTRLISGAFAFTLFDTFGFPIDLTLLMAKEKDFNVDMDDFQRSLSEQKNRSRAATSVDTEDWNIVNNDVVPKYVGYDVLETTTKMHKYRKVKSKGQEQYQIVLETTPFYAESGGQVGDTGTLTYNGQTVHVTDTKKENNLILQFVDQLPENVAGDFIAKVDASRHRKIQRHHSATHLLHAALREVLGKHVAQKGSLVNDEYLRFDFSHLSKITEEEIAEIEKIVNRKIRQNIPVVIKELPKQEAIDLGATALFGEKYGDIVRVVIIDPKYSIELCGGTHVGNTGELGIFKIIAESSVAAGVRRIEALAGCKAEAYINIQLQELNKLKGLLKNPKEPAKAVQQLVDEKNALEKKLEGLEARHLVQVRNELLQRDEIINGVTFVGDIVEVSNPDALKKLCFDLKNKLNDYVAVVCANIGGKPFVAIGISDTVAAARQLDAGKIIKEHISGIIKGGGGGQKTLATAGGQDASNLQQVIEAVKKLL
jgi:alanyl-tRNA synthetase